MDEASTKIGALEERTLQIQAQLTSCKAEFHDGFKSLNAKLDQIVVLHQKVEDHDSEIKCLIEGVDDYRTNKQRAIGVMAFMAAVFGGVTEGLKHIVKYVTGGQ